MAPPNYSGVYSSSCTCTPWSDSTSTITQSAGVSATFYQVYNATNTLSAPLPGVIVYICADPATPPTWTWKGWAFDVFAVCVPGAIAYKLLSVLW
ncbi:hypothetical protein QM012_003772 [Aureobasidium pullulans]|uniref:Uncharacterized protein n=1 Tax=Aureobasidium pullulans TaxID=5580 RepID=A0ABR0T7V9_AURPU